MTKNELRIIYKEKRRELSIHDIDRFNDLILINFQKIALPFISCVHTYLASLNLGEADTASIVRYLQFKNPEMKIAVPKVDFSKHRMYHYQLDHNIELTPNSYGIDEPAEGNIISPDKIDLVLIPLLAFDKNGFRVGYGQGYYDRFLAECGDNVVKIGLSFFDPVDEIDDINTFDVALNYCVTPQGKFRF
ncbi:MAG: 5-formyltetrahydrofolate cyclo-ligase [Ginsengibacter sp.]